MADRSVVSTATLEVFRTTYNSTSVDVGDITTLNNSFSGTATDVIEATNKNTTQVATNVTNIATNTTAIAALPSAGFSIAMAVALG
jgi:hypothetical protein